MTWIADLTWRRPKLVLAAVALFAMVAMVAGRDVEQHLKAAGFTDSASESERATTLLRETLGYDANPGVVLLVQDPDGRRLDVADPAVRNEVARLSREMAGLDGIGRVVNPLTQRDAPGLVASDGESLVISGHLTSADVEDDGGEVADRVRPLAATSWLDVSLTGFAAGFSEVADQTRTDLLRSELIAFPLLALLLLFVFRGLVAAAIPLVIGIFSIVGAMFVLRVMSVFTDTSLFALNIATALSLGLAVDYALLMVSRYREELDKLGPTREAHLNTVRTAGRTALFSGLTVAAALSALVLFPQRFLYSMAVAGASVGILAAVLTILVVPSLIALLGPRIDTFSVRRGRRSDDGSDGWYRLARWVMGRPVVTVLASSALLLAAASPLLWTTLTGPSSEAVAPGLPSHETNEYLADHYPRDITEAVTVTVRGTASPAELARYRSQIADLDGIERGSPFVAPAGETVFANFALTGPALSGTSQGTVSGIRDLEPPGSTETLVSGNTARFIDQKKSLAEHAPAVIVVILAVTATLLFLLTGSVLLPLKTLLMNTLTLGATLGILVLAFQEGLLTSLLGYQGPAAIEVTSLVFLFAVIFGLATDYAVLVMARIKERHDLGDSNEEAVATGIARTGRVITAAAAAIALVFLAFGISSIFFVKQMAIGMAVGVLLDATIVRALLVPALMRLLGRWNWWAPAPLRRVYRRLGISESG